MSAHGGILARRRAVGGGGGPGGLITRKGVLTASTTNGQTNVVDVSGAGFSALEPLRFVLVWMNGQTSSAAINGDAFLTIGASSNDGGAIQNVVVASNATDNVSPGVTQRAINSTACLRRMTDDTTTDMVASCTAFSSTGFTLTYSDAPANASRVHYWAVGGADVTQARAFADDLTSTAATSDIAVGVTQADLVLILNLNGGQNVLTDLTANHAGLGIGAFSDPSAQRATVVHLADQTGSGSFAFAQKARALMTFGAVGTPTALEAEMDSAAKTNWPAGSVRIVSTPGAASDPGVSTDVVGVAIKGSFSKALGGTAARTTTGTTSLGLAVPPTGAFFWGANQPATAAVVNAATDLGAFVVGASDGTNQGCAGFAYLDGSNPSSAGRFHSETRAVQHYVPAVAGTTPPVLASEASAGVSGSAMVLDWVDADTVARETNYLLLGPAP